MEGSHQLQRSNQGESQLIHSLCSGLFPTPHDQRFLKLLRSEVYLVGIYSSNNYNYYQKYRYDNNSSRNSLPRILILRFLTPFLNLRFRCKSVTSKFKVLRQLHEFIHYIQKTMINIGSKFVRNYFFRFHRKNLTFKQE